MELTVAAPFKGTGTPIHPSRVSSIASQKESRAERSADECRLELVFVSRDELMGAELGKLAFSIDHEDPSTRPDNEERQESQDPVSRATRQIFHECIWFIYSWFFRRGGCRRQWGVDPPLGGGSLRIQRGRIGAGHQGGLPGIRDSYSLWRGGPPH